MRLLVATTNQGKQREIVSILQNVSVVVPQDIPTLTNFEVAETGSTFEANALLKAQAYAELTQLPTIADDSGITVNALDGFPGVLSARWHQGTNRERVQALLDKTVSYSDRRAAFVCVICFYDPQTKKAEYFRGEVQGTLSTSQRGTGGFDYDYIFIPDGQTQTYAELGTDFKNQYSHRKLALEKLRAFLDQYKK